ncbi:F-box family protein [Arabidopsis thaliana]|uniref:Protein PHOTOPERIODIC CONTROL OF HYPOCOTYL 1 n=1 Tax=Arabidopsis thaliana TaxID=3702 RepID=PCH1_ARATH|nr:F-box family protein [Arabidopsis thaliana]NP_671856.2 F-box family protein [Arabidopsis thaliana]Q84V03.2 RecName: Full=F-box protein At2g16365 [Arabidopsis thaliana]AEC06484.1 F-box family protein [Arabidopsis thaliana]AEC06486.1 F-box family protein [Arabidopsis thaliana]|eukprot:NP_001118328.1 F-box family protein [Arabidopsis thaliana]
MSEHVMVLGKGNKGISKNSSVNPYESAWLGRWTQSGSEVKFHDGETNCSKQLIRPEDENHGVEVLPFPMFKVSQKRETTTTTTTKPSFHEDVGSSSRAMVNRMPWMYPQGENFSSSNRLDFPIQEKTTQNLLELIRPVRIYATVDSVNLPKEDSHQLLKGSTVSMKLKGKIFGGYLDLFPNQDHSHNRGGVRLQSLESSKDTQEDGPRKNESSAETNTLEMDRLQTIHLSGSISSSSTKGKGIKGYSAIPRTEIPDMNEEPPLVPDRENSVDGHQGETSNSATQSMNVEHFLSRDCKRVRLEPEVEASSRWVKRLKTSPSDSSETKSMMKMKEASLGEKENNNLFLEILKSGINNLQPRNQEPVVSQSNDLRQGGDDITLLHPWIQRWCKKKTTSTDQPTGQEASFEPESHKEFEKKQYPSIAAMALMGKALSGLNPYGLRKTNSLMVWNARDLSFTYRSLRWNLTMADWPLLPNDLLELIMGHLETSFEIFLFRSVCSSWRSVVPPLDHSRCLGIKTHDISFNVGFSFNGRPTNEYCTLKKIPIYLVKFWTPFGDDYLLAEMRERNDGEPKLLLSPLSSNGIKYGMGINKVLFNSLTSPIIPFGQYYEITYIEKRPSEYRFGFPYKLEWVEITERVEFLKLDSEDSRDFAVLFAGRMCNLVMYRSRNMSWTQVVEHPEKYAYQDLVAFKGKFYAVDSSGRGRVFVVELSFEVTEIPSVGGSQQSSKESLVQSGEELLLVQRFTPVGRRYDEYIYIHGSECLDLMKKEERESGFKLMT